MKTCVIMGDMSSDRTADNYPTVVLCDSCAEDEEAKEENSLLVSVGDYDPDFGDTCEFCDKTVADEA